MSLTICSMHVSSVSCPSHYLTNVVSFLPNSLSKSSSVCSTSVLSLLDSHFPGKARPQKPTAACTQPEPADIQPSSSCSCQGHILPPLQLPSTKTHPPSCFPSQALEPVRLSVLSHGGLSLRWQGMLSFFVCSQEPTADQRMVLP